MYTEYFGFTKKPFSLIPDPGFLYLSPNHRKAITILRYGLMSQAGFTVVTGEIGTGKTTLVNYLYRGMRQERTVGLITNTHFSYGDLLTLILAAFGIKESITDQAQRYQCLVLFLQKQFAAHHRAVLIIDEAQNMDLRTLEELRLLSNINAGNDILLQIVLLGQPELVSKLNSPELVQFTQRISVDFYLAPLDFKQSISYIYHRLHVAGGEPNIFSKTACATIYYFTSGVPRLINNICDLSLVFTYGEGKKNVSVEMVLSVIIEKKLGGLLPLQGLQDSKIKQRIRQMVMEQEQIDLAGYWDSLVINQALVG